MFKILEHHAVCRNEGVDKSLVLILREGGVQVVANFRFPIAGLTEQHGAIERFGVHDGRRRIEERERRPADELEHGLAQSG